MPEEKTAMAVTHLYEITSDEGRIDEYEDDEQHRERLHRMFQAIMGDRSARQTVIEFIALERHWIESNEVFNYVEEQFGEDAHLFDVLLQLNPIFAPIDQAWLQELNQETGEGEEEEDDEEDEELKQGSEEYRREMREMRKKSRRDDRLQHEIYPLLLALGGNDFEFGEQESELAGWMVQAVRPHIHD